MRGETRGEKEPTRNDDQKHHNTQSPKNKHPQTHPHNTPYTDPNPPPTHPTPKTLFGKLNRME